MPSRLSIATAASVCLACIVTAQSRRPLTPDNIFELKTVSDRRISPDGAQPPA